MAQVVVRLDDSLTGDLDRLVDEDGYASRSDAIRQALVRLVDEQRRKAIGEAIATGYRAQPQTEGELAGVDAAAAEMIAEEPW